MEPLVSVIIASWNAGATLARAIDSAIEQRFDRPFEIIVVDDGSTDNTSEVLARYGDRIRVIHQERRGNGPARNAAVKNSNSPLLAWLDADDVWMPEKLARTVAALESDPACVLVYSDSYLIDDNGQRLGRYVRRELAHAPTMDEMFTCYWPILESMTVVRRSAFLTAGGFAEIPGMYRANGGGFLWLRMRELGHFVYIDEPLVLSQASPYPDYINKNTEVELVLGQLVRQRYGFIKSLRMMRGIKATIRREHVHNLGHAGLIAMREGRKSDARRSFAAALRHDPTNFKMALRLVRTYLPARLANRLTGRTRMG
jgi:glycosyltransferase involved in cell wall biosynthesis